MIESRTVETVVGVFIALGLAALLMLAMEVSNLSTMGGGGDGYEVRVKFENLGGLKVRSPVKMSGVQVGRVAEIVYDSQVYKAVATLRINAEYDRIPKDTAAKVFTAGLLGEQYVSLDAGGEEEYLKDGDEITLVSNAVVLEQVISQFLYNKAADGTAEK
jgi:phospholipid/cholesterol/gamma-HCH transport system substrate-binding protein